MDAGLSLTLVSLDFLKSLTEIYSIKKTKHWKSYDILNIIISLIRKSYEKILLF